MSERGSSQSVPVHLVVPGALDQRTGGYVYDRRMVEGLRAAGREVVVHELAGSFPFADEAARRAAGAALRRMAKGGLPVIDGLALPAFEKALALLPRRWFALVHHPLALETGLSAADAARLRALEGELLAPAARIIVTSPQTRRDLEDYRVDPARVGVVLPGTEPADLARGSGGPGLALLCIASLTPRKGHLVLLEALAGLEDLDWRLVCVGSAERDPPTGRAVRAAIEAHALGARVSLIGEQPEERLAPFYDAADLFVLASHHEGYGMVLADALAHGLAVVSTTAGAIPDTVPADAGLLVPPADPGALARALRRVITDRFLRVRLAKGARATRARLPSWTYAARAFAAELDRVSASIP
ncbi:MAG: glycosyltransferase family 4 protein [Geminicoccaceae bacterium]